MKKIIAIILTFVMIISLVSCRTASDGASSIVSVNDVVSELSIIEKIESQENVQSQIPQDDTFTSSIAKPDEVKFYKNGKYGLSKIADKNYEIAKLVESWYKPYEFDTLPFCNWEYNEETIAEIKSKETVVEICFKNSAQINMLSKIDHGKYSKIMIPLTGRYAYYVFLGNGEYTYNILLGDLGGKGLEKYFDDIALEKEVRKWQSTVIAPKKITFYKDGMQSVSTDKDFNHKIAKHIESWFKYVTECTSFNGITMSSNITSQKYNSTAVELEFDSEFSFYGGFIQKDERKIFISLDGDYPYTIFTNDGYYDTNWGNMSPVTKFQNKNLEQFFVNRQFEEIQPTGKWESTVYPPMRVQLYKYGELLEESIDKEFNHKIAQYIESWYIYKEHLEFSDVGIKDTTINDIRQNETYIEMFFNSEIKFYGNNILTKDTCCLLIPLTGDFAYFVFAANDDYNYDKYNFPENSKSLELFFDALK